MVEISSVNSYVQQFLKNDGKIEKKELEKIKSDYNAADDSVKIKVRNSISNKVKPYISMDIDPAEAEMPEVKIKPGKPNRDQIKALFANAGLDAVKPRSLKLLSIKAGKGFEDKIKGYVKEGISGKMQDGKFTINAGGNEVEIDLNNKGHEYHYDSAWVADVEATDTILIKNKSGNPGIRVRFDNGSFIEFFKLDNKVRYMDYNKSGELIFSVDFR